MSNRQRKTPLEGFKQCAECKEVKYFRFKYSYRGGRVNMYCDHNGSLWRGRKCPQCIAKPLVKPRVGVNTKGRLCRQCRSPLPATRYFHCLECLQDLPDNDTDVEQYYGGKYA